MPTLTANDRLAISQDTSARPLSQWREILAGLSAEDAAARIMGDLYCYTADRRDGFMYNRRPQFAGDVRNLARALDAWAEIADQSAGEGES